MAQPLAAQTQTAGGSDANGDADSRADDSEDSADVEGDAGMSSVFLWMAQEGKCFFCNGPMQPTNGCAKTGNLPHAATRDHLFPRSRYPHKHHVTVWCHQKCNLEKGDREPTLAEFCRYKLLDDRARAIQNATGKLKQLPKDLLEATA